jgi:predicted dehydrogenase
MAAASIHGNSESGNVENSTGRLRVGLVGAGWVSQYHLRAWRRQAPHAEVVALADPNESALRARAAEFGVGAAYDSAEALVAGAHPDVLDICAPREFHADLVRFAASQGLAAICQKPLAITLGEAERLVADVAGRIPLMVHENWRFRDTYRRIRELLERHTVGDLFIVQLEFQSSGMIPDGSGARPALVRQPFLKTLDRMLIAEILIHHLDTLRFLLGEIDVMTATLTQSSDQIAGEDGAVLSLRRRNDGLPIHVVASLAVHGEPPLPSDRLRILGSDGTIVLDGGRLRTYGRVESIEDFDPATTYQGAYDNAIAHFVDCLGGQRTFETAPGDNLRTLAIVEEIYAVASRRSPKEVNS